MARRHRSGGPAQAETPPLVLDKARPPAAIVLGAPAEVAALVATLGTPEVTCYQMDLYPAERLREELTARSLTARVVTEPDLWDLPAEFQSVLYPVPRGGERHLKIDMVEQAFHVLRPAGTLLVWSPYETDQLFPGLLKKVYGKVHAPVSEGETVFWCQRDGERPRRRHEVIFQARIRGGDSLRFVSRPGVFSYGRFDEGARALAETMYIQPGDSILDIGCGCGTNGIFAAQQSGWDARVTFVDSNVRALALTEHNARENGLTAFQTVASSRVEGVRGDFDVALANPPYYAQTSIAQMFIERSHALLRPGGRFYLVTRQPNQVGPLVVAAFGEAEAVERRGYVILGARRGKSDESVFGPMAQEV